MSNELSDQNVVLVKKFTSWMGNVVIRCLETSMRRHFDIIKEGKNYEGKTSREGHNKVLFQKEESGSMASKVSFTRCFWVSVTLRFEI